MLPPVHRLKKDEIVWLNSHKCSHGHTYLSHYNCFITENPSKAKIGFIDIEASNLKANFGIILCYCIKVANEDKIYESCITKKEATQAEFPDKRLVQQLVTDIEQFDLLYGFYSTKFDLPFIRTRAISNGLAFPTFGSIKHKDIYYVVKNKFSLHSNRLEVACNELVGSSDKTHFDGNIWRTAVQGRKESLQYILEHCRADVCDLEKLTNKILEFAYPQVKSI